MPPRTSSGPGGMPSGGCSRCPSRSSGRSVTWAAWTCSSWPAGPRTCRPGWRAGAHPVAVDVSGEQLATARRLQRQIGPVFPLAQGDGERLPLADGCIDLVVSEHGAAAWCDPRALAARGGPGPAARWPPGVPHEQPPVGPVRAGGRGRRRGAAAPGHREAYRVHWPGGGVEFHPSHGDWVRLLRAAGFVVEALHEVYRPGATARSTRSTRSSRRWAGAGPPRSSGWHVGPSGGDAGGRPGSKARGPCEGPQMSRKVSIVAPRALSRSARSS